MVYIPVFQFTASFEVVSLFLFITELFLLPPQLLTFTCHALGLFTPFLAETILKMNKLLRDMYVVRQLQYQSSFNNAIYRQVVNNKQIDQAVYPPFPTAHPSL